MKRSEAVQYLSDFLASFPDGASHYHTADMCISFLQRLGMVPPIVHSELFGFEGEYKWEEEEQEDESI